MSLRHVGGYSTANLYNMRQFYQVYPDGYEDLLSLTWSHVCILMRIDNPLEENFIRNRALQKNGMSPRLGVKRKVHYSFDWQQTKIKMK